MKSIWRAWKKQNGELKKKIHSNDDTTRKKIWTKFRTRTRTRVDQVYPVSAQLRWWRGVIWDCSSETITGISLMETCLFFRNHLRWESRSEVSLWPDPWRRLGSNLRPLQSEAKRLRLFFTSSWFQSKKKVLSKLFYFFQVQELMFVLWIEWQDAHTYTHTPLHHLSPPAPPSPPTHPRIVASHTLGITLTHTHTPPLTLWLRLCTDQELLLEWPPLAVSSSAVSSPVCSSSTASSSAVCSFSAVYSSAACSSLTVLSSQSLKVFFCQN